MKKHISTSHINSTSNLDSAVSTGTCVLTLKKTGIQAFDDLCSRDEILQNAVSRFDLFAVEKRQDELALQLGVNPFSLDNTSNLP